MNKNVDNVFVPKFIPNNLKWYERDGLNTWYEQGKCQDFLDDLDSHFENLEIVYFALIHSKGNLPETKIKQISDSQPFRIFSLSFRQTRRNPIKFV